MLKTQLPYYPNAFAQYAMMAYVGALLIVPTINTSMIMSWYWWVFGLVSVFLFFHYSNVLTRDWSRMSPRLFEQRLFWMSFVLRVIAVIVLYNLFLWDHDNPFMFHAADSIGYHEVATDILSWYESRGIEAWWQYAQSENGVSDLGYPSWLFFQYIFTGGNIIIARVIKSILGAFTCVFAYRIATRNFGESTGRMAGIFCMLMPNLIMYCGMHLKETEMIFIVMFFCERADLMLRQDKLVIMNLIATIILILLLFTFRTVLGAAALLALGVALMLTNERVSRIGKRWVLTIIVLMIGMYFIGGRIAMEMERYWEDRGDNQRTRLEDRSRKGNVFAKNASFIVFAPMIFTLPFPTMVETENQETFRMLHGGVFVKNIMSGFTILAFFLLFFVSDASPTGRWRIQFLKGEWREHLLIEVMLVAYLGILAMSAFAHAERFHLVAVPLEMIFAAYGVTRINNRYRWLVAAWAFAMFLIAIAWNVFKLRGRGLA